MLIVCWDHSHEISYLILFKKRKMSQKVSSAAVVIGALRVKPFYKFWVWVTVSFWGMVLDDENVYIMYTSWAALV